MLRDVFPAQALAHGQTWQSATDRANTGLIGLAHARSFGPRGPSASPNSFHRFPSGSSPLSLQRIALDYLLKVENDISPVRIAPHVNAAAITQVIV
jgi:hypothetical protein